MADKSETMEISSSNIDKIISDWISQKEAEAILEKLQTITEPLPENLDKVRTELKEINWDKKELSEQAKIDLKSLLSSIEKNDVPTNKESFSWLKEDLSKNDQVMNKIFSISDIYFNEKLKWYNLSDKEKENVKLVLWDNLLHGIDFEWWTWIVIKWINSKLGELLNWSEKKDWKEEKNVTDILNNLSKIYDNLTKNANSSESNILFTTFDWLIWYNFENIKKAKDSWITFDTLEKASISINWDTVWNKTFDQIKKDTVEKAKSLDWLKNVWETINWLFGKLPEGWWDKIKDFLKQISQQYPILWFIIWLFFNLESGWWDKKYKDSLLWLSSLVEKPDSNKDLKKLKIEDLKALDPKNLEKFFKYLDWKDIDYTSEDFWKWLLTWDTKNEKVKEVSEYLKGNEWNVIEWNDNYVENLVKKLNNISDLENKYKLKKDEEELSKIEKENGNNNVAAQKDEQSVVPKDGKQKETSVQWNDTGNSQWAEVAQTEPILDKGDVKHEEVPTKGGKTGDLQWSIAGKNEEIKPVDAWKTVEHKNEMTPEQLARKNFLEFRKSVRILPEIPWRIEYNWKTVEVKIANWKELILWDSKYKLSITKVLPIVWSKDVYKWINMKNWVFEVIHSFWKKEISKEQLITVLSNLLDNKNYSLDIPGEDATLKVEKIA